MDSLQTSHPLPRRPSGDVTIPSGTSTAASGSSSSNTLDNVSPNFPESPRDREARWQWRQDHDEGPFPRRPSVDVSVSSSARDVIASRITNTLDSFPRSSSEKSDSRAARSRPYLEQAKNVENERQAKNRAIQERDREREMRVAVEKELTEERILLRDARNDIVKLTKALKEMEDEAEKREWEDKDVERESREPFVVPALLDMLKMLSRVTTTAIQENRRA